MKWLLVMVGLAVVFRCLAASVMMSMTILFETRAAPRLPDLIVDSLPFIPWIDKWDMAIWISIYLAGCLFLLSTHPRRFIRFMVTDGILSLIRGMTVILTGMGPIKSEDFLAESTLQERMDSIVLMMDPRNAFFSNVLDSHMTKDMFFSGHVAASFMLILYIWPMKKARWLMIAGHLVIVATVFFGHLHYSIDVVGAYAFGLALFLLRETRVREALHPVAIEEDRWFESQVESDTGETQTPERE